MSEFIYLLFNMRKLFTTSILPLKQTVNQAF